MENHFLILFDGYSWGILIMQFYTIIFNTSIISDIISLETSIAIGSATIILLSILLPFKSALSQMCSNHMRELRLFLNY